MSTVCVRAAERDGYLTPRDKADVQRMGETYGEAVSIFRSCGGADARPPKGQGERRLIELFNEMGSAMREITRRTPSVHVSSFETPDPMHGEISRLVAKLRDARTDRAEFVYYIQRAYELIFNFAFVGGGHRRKNYIVVRTPVDSPSPNFAVHKIPDIDERITGGAMCVLLRGALLPSMILSKEVEEYSSSGYVTPFALFKISRDDRRTEATMEYRLRLDRSYFALEELDGRDLFFADPMNATGGSLITVARFILGRGIKPRSIKTFNVVSALKGALRIVRALENAEVYTLWMDPAMNDKAYILPGLGDAGDRLNGPDAEDSPRDVVQLLAGYGAGIAGLYRSQVREIERAVLARRP